MIDRNSVADGPRPFAAERDRRAPEAPAEISSCVGLRLISTKVETLARGYWVES